MFWNKSCIGTFLYYSHLLRWLFYLERIHYKVITISEGEKSFIIWFEKIPNISTVMTILILPQQCVHYV